MRLQDQGTPRPHFPTRVPASFDQALQARRGAWQGHARWVWATEQGRYRTELRTEPRPASAGSASAGSASAPRTAPTLAWASAGGIDEHGVAPERFLTQPARGGARSVNFQRDTGLVSYSGPTGHAPLVPGAQDRLSWLAQLLAVVQGHPPEAPVPTRIPIWVGGPQGDGADWWFEVQVTPTVQGPCWQVQRHAQRRYEVAVSAWVLGGVGGHAQARLAHLVMGPSAGRQPPWELWDEALAAVCGPTP